MKTSNYYARHHTLYLHTGPSCHVLWLCARCRLCLIDTYYRNSIFAWSESEFDQTEAILSEVNLYFTVHGVTFKVKSWMWCGLPLLPYKGSRVTSLPVFFNPLSPSIHIQILQTDLHTFPLRISWENLIKDQGIFFLGDHFINSHNLSVDSVWILLGENWSWSLLAVKGLIS